MTFAYTPAPIPADEVGRLAALHNLAVLDSHDEAEFDALAKAAALICEVPIALISLVDEHRQWFKARVGLEARETPREVAFCAHAILDDHVFEVPNTLDDARFAGNPLVTSAPDIRFYAGAPLILSDGAHIGTLCVIDRVPRHLTDTQRQILEQLGVAAAQALESRRARQNERRLTAELTEAARVAFEATQSKSRFLANMSHEIRTPMNAILGMLALTEKTELTPQQSDYLDKARGAAKSLLGLLNDILDLSKVEAGQMRLESAPFELESMLKDLSVILAAYVGDKPVDLLYHIDPAVPQGLVGDAQRLHQVLLNLAGNAIKFTEAGQVIVQIQQVERTAQTVTLAFSVQDSGIGIAPEHQATIFENFAQAEASTARRFGGTGLGLSICRHLVELMGGQIEVHSTLGEGSTFSFTLTLPIGDVSHEAPWQSLVGQHVLVIDDNPVALALQCEDLRRIGCRVTPAASGAQVLQSLAGASACDWDLMLVDSEMPPPDAWEVLQQVHALQPQRSARMRAVVMTRMTRASLNQRSQEELQRIDGFVVKPMTLGMLAVAAQQRQDSPYRVRQGVRAQEKSQRLAAMRILLVEDNALNQQIARELLTAEGAQVVVAGDGQQGVQAVQSAQPPFDVVLMDVQMPVMDGYAASRYIRRALGLHTLPIVAMTANAMDSERQACLDAGMTEHVSKPFDLNQLVHVLWRLTGRTGTPPATLQQASTSAAAAPQGAAGLLDMASALARMGGARAVYAEVAQDFMATAPATLQQVLAAAQTDPALAARELHTLKGLAHTVGAQALGARLAQLEQSLSAGDAASLQLSAADLQAQLHAVAQALQEALA